MEFVPEWKSRWPISSTFSAPLLIPNKKQETPFGPLIFTHSPNSSTPLLQSHDLSPHLPPLYPHLSCSRFLRNYSSVPSSGSASSIPSLVGAQIPDYSSCFHGFNSLQLLQIPNKNLIIAFFLTGENSDYVGFSLLSVRDGILSVHSQMENFFHLVKEGNVNHQRITLLLANPVDDLCVDENGDGRKIVTVGFLMVCTHYSVYWYRVGITSVYRQSDYSVCLDYLGCANAKILRGNTVVSACWSPHLREECLVLLENGDLLLFDVSSFGGKVRSIFSVSGNNRVVNTRVQVSLADKLGLQKEESGTKGRDWFKCEFSWHPRLFIASHSTELFLVDLRSPGECNVCSLLKLEMLSVGKNDRFFALSRVHSDGFFFTVATKNLLLLCDVRKPFMPVLRWAHGVQNPRYMTVFRLSELRANAEDKKYKLASESGYCIMLGSFWDNEFSFFCYGPDGNGNESFSSKSSKLCNLYYAWGLPSKFSLSDSNCKCGSCVVREEFTEMSLPSWIDWRQKKHLVLGFGILEADISAQLSSLNNSLGGFMLIRLTSLGKLEAQHYHAAWESEKFPGAGHKRKSIYLEDNNLLYDRHDLEYDGVKKFQHFKLESLGAFLKGKLEKYIVKRREKMEDGYEGNARKRHLVKSKLNFHQEICPKLKAFEVPEARGLTVLKDISLPTAIREIALSSMFSALPTNLMQFAFSTYSDFDEVPENHNEPLEFLNIPDQPQVPPFTFRKPSDRSSKWSSKVQPSNSLVGPIIPPLFLTTLHNLWMEERKEKRELYLEESEEFTIHARFKRQCDKVMAVVQDHVLGSDDKTRDDDFVSLADDTEPISNATQKLKLSLHRPSAFLESPSSANSWKPGSEVCMFSTHVFRSSQELASDIRPGMVGKELFDVGCPIELKFDDCTTDCGPKELEMFQNLKKRDLDFQRRFKPYQDYISRQDG
ncbi:hypothetical protein PHJA_000901100 [Phtheirospermum japonicum]|uniref:Uncharacterized protein n=1 Tax=Phtheirospermum japonicum TaxID=374723 RepID=A0A830BSZ4_9LAMI|nr:hypothetical protein PHJA_000901100 [Phtheirospermum japonicum]